MGGNGNNFTRFDEIYVLYLKTMTFGICDIRIPCTEYFCTATIKNDVFDNELLINGYIRNITYKIGVNIPNEINKLILSWLSIEVIYLLSIQGHLWKIDVNDILNATINIPVK